MTGCYTWRTPDGTAYMWRDEGGTTWIRQTDLREMLEELAGAFCLTEDEELLDYAIEAIVEAAGDGKGAIAINLVPTAEELDGLCGYRLFVERR